MALFSFLGFGKENAPAPISDPAKLLFPSTLEDWGRDPNQAGILTNRLRVSKYEQYELKVKINEVSGLISEFAARRLQLGPFDTLNEARFPDFAITEIQSQTGRFLDNMLFGNSVEDKSASTISAIEDILLKTPLSQMSLNAAVIKARFKANRGPIVCTQLKHYRSMPPEVGMALIEGIAGGIPKPDIATCAKTIAEMLPYFSSDRPRLANALLTTLFRAGYQNLVVSLCWDLKGHQKSWNSENLLSVARGLHVDIARLFLDTAFKRVGQDRSSMINSIMENVSAFADDARRTVLEEFVARVVQHRKFSLLSALDKCPPTDLLGVRPSNLSEDLALEVAGKGERTEVQAVVRHLELFSNINHLKLAKAISERDGFKSVVTDSIASFKNLSEEIALNLADDMASELIIRNLSSFSIPSARIIVLATKLLKGGHFKLVLEHFKSFPAAVQEGLNEENFLKNFVEEIGIQYPELYLQYLQFKKAGENEELENLIRSLRNLEAQMLSSSAQDPDLSKHQLYRFVMHAIYPMHFYAPFHQLESCQDRTSDLAPFKYAPRYKIDLSLGIKMVLKPGAALDELQLDEYQLPIKEAKEKFQGVAGNMINGLPDKNTANRLLEELLDSHRAGLTSHATTTDERIFCLMLLAQSGEVPTATAKKLIVQYHLLNTPNLVVHMEQSIDRVSSSKNPEYSHLLELREFFADSLRDSIKAICANAIRNVPLAPLISEHAATIERGRITRAFRDKLNRAQIQKIGANGPLIDEIMQLLGKHVDSPGFSAKKLHAVGNMLHAEQRKIARLLKDFKHTDVNPEEIHLGSFNASEFMDSLAAPEIDLPDKSKSWLIARTALLKLFDDEVKFIDGEIKKFTVRSAKSKKSLVLEAFFSKNRSSAYARSTAGVCVANDNPRKETQFCQWNMPNYLQLVLSDPERPRCEGLVLLHLYEDQGKKILTASLNPTSTYLHKVDEKALFFGIFKILTGFANENGIDILACSSDRHIRSNRMGGEFERAIESSIRRVNKKLSLSAAMPFSFQPTYSQKELDIIWERGE